MQEGVRLQKHLAACGVASRRACETLIAAGAVAVNGVIVTQPGTRVDPARHTVTVHGRPVVLPESSLYLVLNKPAGYLCTNEDTHGRPTCLDLLPELGKRLYTVGRLDLESEGLLLVTNDGAFAQALSHPSHSPLKTYRVRLNRPLEERDLRRLVRGIQDGDEMLRAVSVTPWDEKPGGRDYAWVLAEGRNRQIRRMTRAVDRRILRLQRVSIGSLKLGTLRPGTWRHLREEERQALLAPGEGKTQP